MAKVCIDAGHYGKYNRSPVNKNYYEAVQMWKLHERLVKELRKRGVEVIVTRSNQATDLALVTRGKKAKGCDLFLSLHSNASDSASVDYPVAIVLREDHTTKIDDLSEDIGLKLVKVVQAQMGTKQAARTMTKGSGNDRDGNGRLDDEYYGVLHGTKLVKVPGVILEHSFHTNAAATNWLLVDANLQNLAEAEADCIAAWLGIKTNVTKTGKPYGIKIHNCSALNIRSGPGTKYGIVGKIADRKTYTIIDEQNGWGKLKSGAGWISLAYTKKV